MGFSKKKNILGVMEILWTFFFFFFFLGGGGGGGGSPQNCAISRGHFYAFRVFC